MKKKLLIIFYFFIVNQIYSQNIYLDNHFESEFYLNHWTGFYLYDPIEKKELYNYNGNKYFIPASNVKILTLYTGLKMIQDSIPSLRYISRNDTLYISGTGDPTLLESYFKECKVLNFLKEKAEKIAFCSADFDDHLYGPGWAWEDYSEYFSPERTVFPIYGNTVTINENNSVYPNYFMNLVKKQKKEFPRELRKNEFYYYNSKKIEVPFITSDTLVKKLLEIEIEKPIFFCKKMPNEKINFLYSIPSDSLYKRMMLVSDNFIAEQILLMSSLSITNMLSSKNSINYMLSTYLNNLPQTPKWVDGSGLSRYNNFTPMDFVFVLDKLYNELPYERLINLFPTNGINGTLKNNFKSKNPYIFAKTGSMRGVYNLSGYLKTNSGKVLIFSFMNNNFQHSFKDLKNQIQKVLEYVRDHY